MTSIPTNFSWHNTNKGIVIWLCFLLPWHLLHGQEHSQSHGAPPVIAPYTDIDTYTINDWWNREENHIIDLKVPRDQVVAFAIYTVADSTLKLTAQMYPLYPDESRQAILMVQSNTDWVPVDTAVIQDLGWSAHFRVDNWDESQDVRYRVTHDQGSNYEGLIRRMPSEDQIIKVAALSCNSLKDRGLRENYVRNINYQNPDVVFFAGDQSYDHLQHTSAWIKFGLQFGEVFRNRPCITIPDDHDIGQPNLWGEGGKKSLAKDGSDGGYMYHPEYVRTVERQQTWHLPDPYDPTPIQQNIGVYYTQYTLGGVDFAIIEDRKFKSGPQGTIPQQGPRPDHINDPDYDPASIDIDSLVLLGDRQLTFLDDWANQNPNKMKVVLSQTGFMGGAHLHGKKRRRLYADLDSNGWPQSGRNQALRIMDQVNAIHIAGDQHLATVVQHGINDFGDGPWAFVVPAIENTYYSRWWWPEDEQAGGNPPETPLPWTGNYRDGFDNHLTMYAYANPDQASVGAGYGLIILDVPNKTVTFECWPREVDVTKSSAQQFEGWPITITANESGEYVYKP